MISPEELKLYTALQPFFREKMGDWQVGDRVIDTDHGFGNGLITSVNTSSFGVSFDNGQHCGYCDYSGDPLRDASPVLIRLPLPIDPRNPGRGLWGMMDWGRWRIETWNDGYFRVYNILKNGTTMIERETPTLVLLKALAVQEGIEI